MKFEDSIVIIGVPRSGTTLLRVLLGGNSMVKALPETPWITGSQGTPSLRKLVEEMQRAPSNPVTSIPEVSEDTMIEAARRFFAGVVEPSCSTESEERVLIKTPDDIKYLDFLVDFFEGAKFIHITRDGRDVALSTVKGRNDLLGLNIAGYGLNNIPNSLKRWSDWEGRICDKSKHMPEAILHVKYEDLVINTEEQLRRICEFLDLDYEKGMIDYGSHSHVLPSWEQGSKDVREQGGININKVNRWKNDMLENDMLLVDHYFADDLKRYGYTICSGQVQLQTLSNVAKLKWSTDALDRRERRNLRVSRCLSLPKRFIRVTWREMKRMIVG